MPKIVEIDRKSGFCGGVIRAINRAEKFVDDENKVETLYSLGSIVHNEAELSRLSDKGLITIDKTELSKLKGKTVLIRAHGEPPKTYQTAKELGLNLIDCTCPVVLRLQKNIKDEYAKLKSLGNGQIIIFGKKGHAEVLGLLGQIGEDAIVIQNKNELFEALEQGTIKLNEPISIFSQTTKSPDEYNEICLILQERMANANNMSVSDFIDSGLFQINNTVCSQVSSRHKDLQKFSINHDVIIFVAGKESSNGKVLFNLCKQVNQRTYHINSIEELNTAWYNDFDSVGVCGATSTPKWLLEEVAEKILKG